MARIRSVHPGLFTDEDFVALTDAAQIFYIGLLTEADDQGLFEWKPLTLRMRLRPAKDGDVAPLLAELVDAGRIQKAEIKGREYGAIRNFRKYQRPKSPNAVHPITDDLRIYVGLSPYSSEIGGDDEDLFLRNGETSPQREEGGGRGRGKSSSRSSDDYPAEFEMLWSALPKRNGSNDKKAAYAQWKARRKAGHTTEDMQAGAVRYAAWCRATGKENTETVKQAATFLGPADPPHFMLSWLPPGQTTAAAATEIASCDDSLRPWLPKLRQQFDVPTINSWFANCSVVERDDWFTLLVPTKWSAAYIEQNFGGRLRQVFGEQFQVGHGTPRAAA